jgi:hypothetical protein
MLFVDLIAGAVGRLDFELEQLSSSSQMKLPDQWGQSTAVSEDIVEVIGAVSAAYDVSQDGRSITLQVFPGQT